MNLELTGKVALVTGSSRGIGKAIASGMLREGAKVMLNGREAKLLDASAKELGGETSYFTGDLTNSETCHSLIDAVLKRWGRLDILVCNIGSGSSSLSPGKETAEEWLRMWQENFLVTANIVGAAADALSIQKGAIVCVSSICGIETLGAPITYSSAKAALNSYVNGISRPLAKRGIRINALAPGNILFPGSVWEKKMGQDSAKCKEMLERDVAMGRFGSAEEITDFCLFLSSPRASFSTGSIYVVDGGQLRSG